MSGISASAARMRIVVFLLVGFSLVLFAGCSSNKPKSQSATATATPKTASAPGGSSENLQTAMLNAIQQVRPATVQVTNEQTQFSFSSQPFTTPAGVGSGILYDSEGHVLTNNHVVAGAQKLLVSLPDGRSFTAQLVGSDAQTDLAVLKINGSNLPVAKFGGTTAPQVGQFVVAIGNALALPGGPTVTEGVVSATGRTVQEPGSNNQGNGPFLFDLVQTSAPINPGNSGGPLVNLNGEVIGINTLVAGQAEPGVQSQGIGFAISIGTAKPIADELVKSGHVTHPYLGVSYVPLTPAIAAQLGTSQQQGVVIGSVASGSPAATAGIQARDIITAIDGKQLIQESDLAQIVNSHQPGDTVTLSIIRGSNKSDVKVKLGQAPSQ